MNLDGDNTYTAKKDFVFTENDTKSVDDSTSKTTSMSIIANNTLDVNEDLIFLNTRTQKSLEFLWKKYFVLGNINILSGEPGTGKSFFICWLLAAVSTGAGIPFSIDNFEIGTSILVNAEDDIDGTILERLVQNGADLSKIAIINEDREIFSIQQIKRLEENIKKIKPKLVVIDPITAYIGNINMYSANEVREALKPLKIMAQKYNCAIIIIMHLNKNTGATKATHRTMGSMDFIALARSVLLITENPENSSERILIPIKTNLMKEDEKASLSFRINDDGKIEWLSYLGTINPDDLLLPNDVNSMKPSYEQGFIIGTLANGDIKANDLKALAIEKGGLKEKSYNIAKATLKKDGKIDYYQNKKEFYWTLKYNERKD